MAFCGCWLETVSETVLVTPELELEVPEPKPELTAADSALDTLEFELTLPGTVLSEEKLEVDSMTCGSIEDTRHSQNQIDRAKPMSKHLSYLRRAR